MARNYYDVLGVAPTCTAAEIRSAHRQLVLRYHPDRTSDPRAAERFLEITEAYETLSDPAKRKDYDLVSAARVRSSPRPTARPRSEPAVDVQSELLRLTVLFSRGSHQETEKLARKVVRLDPRQAVPYAILGDLARARGDLKEASKMYAFAIQMDPGNATYGRRYEELMGRVAAVATPSSKHGRSITALAAGGGTVLLAGTYLSLSKEPAYFHSLPLISSWTLGLVVMAFISGVALGASLAIGNWMDRFGANATNSLGRPTPWMALATVAIVSFWVAALLYAVVGAALRSGNVSTSRLIVAVAAGVCLLSLAAEISASLSASQVFLWSGNLMYLGGISGWMAADALRGKD